MALKSPQQFSMAFNVDGVLRPSMVLQGQQWFSMAFQGLHGVHFPLNGVLWPFMLFHGPQSSLVS